MNTRKLLVLALLCTIFSTAQAQSNYEAGYYINNSGQRIEGYIQNNDWKNSPSQFRFKTNLESKNPETLRIGEVSEFGIGEHTRYGRFEVDIDRSGMRLAVMSRVREPQFSQETLFLKYLVEGDASLLSYSEPDLIRYFYLNAAGGAEQLIRKQYRTSRNSVETNNSFRLQLWENFQCETIQIADTRSTDYSQKDLTGFFEKVNICKGADHTVYVRSNKSRTVSGQGAGSGLRINLLAGYQQALLSINSETFREDFDFDSHSGVVFGAEVEYELPFNNGVWTLVLQPVYQNYKSTERNFSNSSTDIDYSSLIVPLLIRRYVNLGQDKYLFINGGLSAEFPLSDGFNFPGRPDMVADSPPIGVALGVGFSLGKKYSIEIKHNFERNILANDTFANTPFKNTQVLIGYNLF